jgi:hypothetical protein
MRVLVIDDGRESTEHVVRSLENARAKGRVESPSSYEHLKEMIVQFRFHLAVVNPLAFQVPRAHESMFQLQKRSSPVHIALELEAKRNTPYVLYSPSHEKTPSLQRGFTKKVFEVEKVGTAVHRYAMKHSAYQGKLRLQFDRILEEVRNQGSDAYGKFERLAAVVRSMTDETWQSCQRLLRQEEADLVVSHL